MTHIPELPHDPAGIEPPSGSGDARVWPSRVEERRPLLHPEFFPDTETWELGGRRARTLRDLLKQFPAGTEFEGYYPQGYVASCGERGSMINEARRAADAHALMLARESISKEVKVYRATPQDTNRGPRLHKRKYNHDVVLDLWTAGHTSEYIELLTGTPKHAVGGIVHSARESGDPRAKRRKTGKPSKYDLMVRQALRAGDGQVSA